MIFNAKDAMILYSIYREKPGVEASLKEIIGFVDYINHDILTYEEFNSSLHKLSAAGLVRVAPATVCVTVDYTQWRTEKFKGKKAVSVYKEMKEIALYLNSRTAPVLPDYEGEEVLNKGKFQQAVADYLNK